MPHTYIPRFADARLAAALRRAGGVLVEGPKACGKTATAARQAASVARVDADPNVAAAVTVDPGLVLAGDTPRLLDEWQVAPRLWNAARHEIDACRAPGQFILTGSTAPVAAEAHHSGAGRFARLTMSTLTLAESGDSDGSVSLAGVIAGAPPRAAAAPLDVRAMARRIAVGGWPGNLGLDDAAALANNRDYLRTVAAVDLATVQGVRHDPVRVGQTLRSLARGVASELTVSTLSRDVGVTRESIGDYLDALARIFISVDQPAWGESLRSRAPLRRAPKRHLAEPSLAVAALECSGDELLTDIAYLGQLFESQVVHDLRALSGEPVYHARSAAGLEVDAVLRLGGRLALIEVELGAAPPTLDAAADSLSRFAAQTVQPDPARIIITAQGASYRRPDGVDVVNLAHLAP